MWFRVHHSCSAGWPDLELARLNQVLWSAARLDGWIPKFSPVYMCDVLHWLPVFPRILYHIIALVLCCILDCVQSYLCDLCLVSSVAVHRVLRLASWGELLISTAHLAIMHCHAFSVVDPSIWNNLQLEQRSLLVVYLSEFYRSQVFFLLLWLGWERFWVVSWRGAIYVLRMNEWSLSFTYYIIHLLHAAVNTTPQWHGHWSNCKAWTEILQPVKVSQCKAFHYKVTYLYMQGTPWRLARFKSSSL